MTVHEKPTYRTLKSWRRASRLTTRTAASLLGISQSKYMRMELGRLFLKGPEAKSVAQITGVPLSTLVGAE